ncbi:MAG: DUF1343 domain-containing protein [Microbacterium sp.]
MLGVERLLAEDGGRSVLAGRRVGLIANPTSVDRALTPTADLLRAEEARGGYRLTALFAPEHGLHAAAEATSLQEHGVDPRTGLPVWSLYSETTEPTRRMLADVDVLVFDLQDVGVRYYTFIWTMYRAMAAAAREGRAFVVLDRPNPLGDRVDGPTLLPALQSFVGLAPLPMQHGLTVGELASYLAAELLGGQLDLTVVPMTGYDPGPPSGSAGLLWVPPSPNLPHRSSVWAHAATGLIDGTTASQGVGTSLPFEWVGDPSIDAAAARRLASELDAAELEGVAFRPMLARPSLGKAAGELCGGVQLHIVDADVFRPARVAVHLLAAMRGMSQTQWLARTDLHRDGEVGDFLWVDRLSGDDELRRMLDDGVHPDVIVEGWGAAAAQFSRAAEPHRLYGGVRDGARE